MRREDGMADELEGRRALVTGGSSGIGADIARELADRGADVLLVARREERLREVSEELTDEYGVESDWISMDLANRDAPDELYEETDERGHRIDVLVNNAGFGVYGGFMDSNWDRQEAMLELNLMTPIRLTKLFARDMVDRGWGRILQVSSFGAFQPTPNYGLYSATKSALLDWGEAVDFELDGTGVTCTVTCPGVTRTEFFADIDQDQTWFQKLTMTESSAVAERSVDAMMRGKMSHVPGFLDALSVFMVRFLPRRFVRWFAYQTMRNE
jgi:short-subunit dehydrogenase